MSRSILLASVVLPVRNGARYLAESLASVLAQEIPSLEVVAVDDGSTDATPDMLRSFAGRDSRVRIVTNDTSLRLPGALNRGFAAATGEFLTWTSDDNLFRPGALARMSAALSQRAESDIAYADYTLIDERGEQTEARRLPSPEHLGYSNIIGPCFLFRRRVFEALGGFTEDLFLAEDYDFWLRAVTRFRFVHLEEDLYLYRVHPAALGTSRRPEVLAATEQALRRNVASLPRQMRYEAYERLKELARARGDASAARAAWFSALRCAPFRALRRSARQALSSDG